MAGGRAPPMAGDQFRPRPRPTVSLPGRRRVHPVGRPDRDPVAQRQQLPHPSGHRSHDPAHRARAHDRSVLVHRSRRTLGRPELAGLGGVRPRRQARGPGRHPGGRSAAHRRRRRVGLAADPSGQEPGRPPDRHRVGHRRRHRPVGRAAAADGPALLRPPPGAGRLRVRRRPALAGPDHVGVGQHPRLVPVGAGLPGRPDRGPAARRPATDPGPEGAGLDHRRAPLRGRAQPARAQASAVPGDVAAQDAVVQGHQGVATAAVQQPVAAASSWPSSWCWSAC